MDFIMMFFKCIIILLSNYPHPTILLTSYPSLPGPFPSLDGFPTPTPVAHVCHCLPPPPRARRQCSLSKCSGDGGGLVISFHFVYLGKLASLYAQSGPKFECLLGDGRCGPSLLTKWLYL